MWRHVFWPPGVSPKTRTIGTCGYLVGWKTARWLALCAIWQDSKCFPREFNWVPTMGHVPVPRVCCLGTEIR
jgi:hypothetical protein